MTPHRIVPVEAIEAALDALRECKAIADPHRSVMFQALHAASAAASPPPPVAGDEGAEPSIVYGEHEPGKFVRFTNPLHRYSAANLRTMADRMAPPPPPADLKAAAWRWRRANKDRWIATTHEPTEDDLASFPDRPVVEPLYTKEALSAAHAAGKAEGEAERREAIDTAEWQFEMLCNRGWAHQIQWDAREVLRNVQGIMLLLRQTLGLPEYKRPPLWDEAELPLPIKSADAATARAEALEEAKAALEEEALSLNATADECVVIKRWPETCSGVTSLREQAKLLLSMASRIRALASAPPAPRETPSGGAP